MKEYPLFGIGAGNFLKASLKYNVGNNISDSAHNIFLEVATEQGIPAALLLLAIALLVLSSILNHPPACRQAGLPSAISFSTFS